MSHYLSQLEGSERAQECIRNDEKMSNLHPVFIRALAPFMPAMFTEAELIAADLAYLEGQARRDRERIAFLQEQELNRLREAGGL